MNAHSKPRHSADPVQADLGRESVAAASLIADLRTDDAELAHDMVEGETDLLEALAAALDEIDECEVIAAGCKVKAEQITARGRRSEERAKRVRAMIERAMVTAGLPAVRLPTATLTVREIGPRPVIGDESLIPSEFWEPQPPKLDRKALNAAAKDRVIPGVEMSNGSVSLQVRRS